MCCLNGSVTLVIFISLASSTVGVAGGLSPDGPQSAARWKGTLSLGQRVDQASSAFRELKSRDSSPRETYSTHQARTTQRSGVV